MVPAQHRKEALAYTADPEEMQGRLPEAQKNLGKYTGRKAGTRNRRTAAIQQALETIGFNPVLNMCRIACKAEKDGDLALAGTMNKEIAKYFAPQLKALEVKVEDGKSVMQASKVLAVLPVDVDDDGHKIIDVEPDNDSSTEAISAVRVGA